MCVQQMLETPKVQADKSFLQIYFVAVLSFLSTPTKKVEIKSIAAGIIIASAIEPVN